MTRIELRNVYQFSCCVKFQEAIETILKDTMRREADQRFWRARAKIQAPMLRGWRLVAPMGPLFAASNYTFCSCSLHAGMCQDFALYEYRVLLCVKIASAHLIRTTRSNDELLHCSSYLCHGSLVTATGTTCEPKRDSVLHGIDACDKL